MAMYSKEIVEEEQKIKIDELKFTIWMNMSQIYINQQKYEKSLER